MGCSDVSELMVISDYIGLDSWGVIEIHRDLTNKQWGS